MQGQCTKIRGEKGRKVSTTSEVDEISIDDFMKVDLRVAEVLKQNQ